jgi:hypothetical protein
MTISDYSHKTGENLSHWRMTHDDFPVIPCVCLNMLTGACQPRQVNANQPYFERCLSNFMF